MCVDDVFMHSTHNDMTSKSISMKGKKAYFSGFIATYGESGE